MTKRMEKWKQTKTFQKILYIFGFTMLLGLALWILHQTLRITIFDLSFFSNTIFGSYDWDYYMDYFNVNAWLVDGQNPYTSYAMSSYPPLALVLAKFFSHFGTYTNGSLLARESLPAMVSYYAMFLIFTCLSLAALIYKGKKNQVSTPILLLTALVLFGSAPYIYLFGRGNYWVVAVAAIAWFYALYDSDKRWHRELALLLLSMAAAIKLYPALLAAILLKQRRFSDFFKVVLYTILLFFLPFLCFEGGFSNISVFLHNLLDFQGKGQASSHNYSMPTFLYYFAQLGSGLRLSSVPDWCVTVGRWCSYLILFLGISASLLSDQTWKSFTLITLGLIVFPAPSYSYSACMLLPVVALFLFENKKEGKDYGYMGLFLCILLPTQFGNLIPTTYIAHSWDIGITVSNFLQHMAIIILFGILLYDAIKNGLITCRTWRKNIS